VSLAGWSEAIETNLTSAFLAAKYQLPAMLRRGSGSLIFISTSSATPPACRAWLDQRLGEGLVADVAGNGHGRSARRLDLCNQRFELRPAPRADHDLHGSLHSFR
jgi:NAD(P)-dependent dehydrogenase (short-subunit alcohol dehydrogenase family)